MAANRYGQIWHGDHHHINLRFPSVDSRKDYADKFSEYHGSHDHDGEAPRFELANASDIGVGSSHVTVHDVKYVTLDGYCAHEIEAYHERTHKREYTRYRPPTCCVPPILSIHREFVRSDTLGRHELSAIFGDMPADDYQSLLTSIQRDGFIDEVIKLYDGKILDGWHRYCAARELNLIRKLRFQVWHEDEHRDGDPKAFVLGRNIERRHLTPGQRAQIVVSFSERFGMGRPKSEESVPSGTLKSREQLAQKAGVGVRTIARAVEVEKEGESEAVIRGKKTAGEVLLAKDRETAKQAETEMWEAFRVIEEKVSRDNFKRGACRHHTNWGVEDIPAIEDMKSPKVWKARFDLLNGEIRAQATWIKALIGEDTEVSPPIKTDRYTATVKKRKKQVLKNIWDTRVQVGRDYIGDSDTDLNLHLTLPELEMGFIRNNESYAEAFGSGMQRIDKAASFKDFQDRAFEVDEHGLAKVDISALEEEYRAIMTYAGDIRQWKREDWSPDTNWILPLIEAKKQANADKLKTPKSVPDSELEDTVASLWERITPAISVWKAARKGKGVGHASKTMFISAIKCFDAELSRDSETDVVLLKKLLDTLNEVYSPGYTFERYIKMQCDGASIWDAAEDDAEAKVSDEADAPDDDRRLNDRAEAHHHDDSDRATSAMDECRADLLEVWQQQDVYTWEGLEMRLYVEEYGLSADAIVKMQREIAAAHPKPPEPCEPETDADEDTSLAEIDNLPAVKYFLESLLKQTKTFIHPHDKDDFSISVFDALMVDSDLTERQQLLILIDCAYSIVMESESTSF